jgi:hypothetical protein
MHLRVVHRSTWLDQDKLQTGKSICVMCSWQDVSHSANASSRFAHLSEMQFNRSVYCSKNVIAFTDLSSRSLNSILLFLLT